MSWKLNNLINLATTKKATVLILSLVFFFALSASDASAQKKFQKTYPASKNIRLQLTNRTGTITVQGWNRDEVRIEAQLDKPIAKIIPQNKSGLIYINVVQDNQGRDEVGDVNFTVYVPYSSSIDIETRIGNLNVTNVQGGLLRAHISSEGDITLTNIGSSGISAKNLIGDIFYDGLIQPNGTYVFTSTQGNINIRIPLESNFSVVATAPSTRNIDIGPFNSKKMKWFGTGRRLVGEFGDGSATVKATNQQGNISFLRR